MMTDSFFRKKEFLFGSIALLVIVLDQLTKYLVEIFQPNINLKILSIEFIKNTGMGFGLLPGKTLWLAIISLVVALGIILNYGKIPENKTIQALFAIFLGGTVGNLIDRAFRGYVIDFINLKIWPAFNLADACLTVSVIGIIIWYWGKEK